VKTRPAILAKLCSLLILALALVSCGGCSSSSPTFTVGGSVSGLVGSGLVLQNNGGNDLAIAANGSFVFPAAVGSWSVYGVTIKTQPTNPPQTCVVSGGNGTLAISNVSNVVVTCTTHTFTVGGSVSGLVGSGFVLQDNGRDDRAIAANGSFVFSAAVASGSAYAVTIKTQPTNPSQTCVLSGDKGTIGAAAVSNVVVTCTIQTYTVGGSVGGLIGSGLVLQNNSGNDLPISATGSFVFSAAVASGSAYAVTIKTQPTNPSQTCVLSGDEGAIGAANVSNVVVTCTIQPGRFAYVSGTGVYCFAIDAVTGALTALAGSPCDSGERVGVAADPSGKFIYATLDVGSPSPPPVGVISSYVTAYAINSATGSLAAIAGSQLDSGGVNVVDVTVDPSGQFVYEANYSGGISAFKINSVTGGLTGVPGSPFATAPTSNPYNISGVNSVTVDPTGKFVYAAIEEGDDISAFVIDSSTGALTPVTGSPFHAGTTPATVRVDPSGRFAYATNMGSNSISAYLVNSSSGALTPIAGSPFSTGPLTAPGPYGLAVDPSGRFVYVTTNGISAFSIDNSTGALTPISGSPFASGPGPSGAFVHPSGKFLYVTNNGAGTISGYTIDSTSGTLTPISGSPFVASGSGSNGTYVIAFSN
jgi:6-phosphogluconolactonase (cycloisomerase 2 family)